MGHRPTDIEEHWRERRIIGINPFPASTTCRAEQDGLCDGEPLPQNVDIDSSCAYNGAWLNVSCQRTSKSSAISEPVPSRPCYAIR